MADDSGTFDNGTPVDKAFIDDICDQIDDQAHSSTNPTQKPRQTTDEVIAARGSKASLDARLDVALNDDGTPKAVAGQATESQVALAEGNINAVLNADLERWTAGTTSAPDNYTLAGAGAAILKSGPAMADTTDIGTGTYCARVTSGAGAAATLTQQIITAAEMSKYRAVRGRKVGFTIRGKASVVNALRIAVDDGAVQTTSSYHAGDGSEAYLTVVHTISNSATKLDVYAQVALGANQAYVGGFTVVFSDLAPAAWTPLWARFRQAILDEAQPSTMKLGGSLKSVPVAGVLMSSTTQVTKSANNDVFYTIAIPGGTLAADGDRLRVTAWFFAENATGSNIVPFAQFGATAIVSTAVGAGAVARFKIEVELQRTGATAQVLMQNTLHYNSGAGTGQPYISAAATPGETLSGSVDLTIKLNNTGAARNITANGYVVEFLPKVA